MAERHGDGPINFNEQATSGLQVPKLAADPTTPQTGDIWLNTTSHAVKVRTNTATTTVLGSGSGVSKFAANFGDGAATSYAITHNLGTLDVTVKVFVNSSGADVTPTSITRNSINQVTIVMGSAPALNADRVVVIG